MKLYETIAIIVRHFQNEDVITSSNFENDHDNLGGDINWED